MPRASRLLCLLAVVALGGCRPGTAFGDRYNNLRAYYNTFYNAERALEEGERTLERSTVRIDRSQLVPVFPVSQATGTTGPFQEAIDKSAELLRNRPTSKWADDALLVIGKAYFYQRNIVGAEQKFRETMAAAVLADDRRLGDEARFWLGRTYALADRYDDGVAVLEEGLADDDGDRRWTARMRLALGELYARAGRWDEAAEALATGAPDEDDADVAARAYVLLGQVEAFADRPDRAADAYAEALRRRPDYELAFAAELDRALVLGLDGGDPSAGLAIVRAMRSDDKHYDRRAELALAEARLRAADGQADRALALFRDVLYDAALPAANVSGETHYRLGQFYRDVLGDYVLASAHFDTAATSLRAPPAEVRPARDAILDVSDEARTYNVLATSARRMSEVDSLLALGALSDEDLRARIEAIESERRRVFLEEQRRLDALRQAQAFSGGGGNFGEGRRAGAQRQSAGGAAETSTSTGEAGFLAYRDPASVQAGLIAFQQRWGDRPLVAGWRYRASIQAGAVGSDRGVVTQGPGTRLAFEAGPPPLDLSAIPRTPAKRDELVTELAGLRYELANAFFLSLGRADTAAALYRQVLGETPDLPVATRARYALAEIERAAGRDDVARPLYQAVADADSSALRQASLERLGLAPDVPEATAETSVAYREARERWRAGDRLGAARDLVAFADANPDHPDAPRAYLGAAVALVESRTTDPPPGPVSPVPDSVRLSVPDSMSVDSTIASVLDPPLAGEDSTQVETLDSVEVGSNKMERDSTVAPAPATVVPPDSVRVQAERPTLTDATVPDSVALGLPLPPALVSRVLLVVADSLIAAEAAAPPPAAPPPAAPPPSPRPAPDVRSDEPDDERIDRADDERIDRADDERIDRADDERIDRADDERIDRTPEDPVEEDLRGAPQPVGAPRPVGAPQPAGEAQAAGSPQAAPVPSPAADAPAEDAPAEEGEGSAGAAPEATPLAAVDSTSFTLWHHLTALAARYPATPEAARARALAEMLPAPARETTGATSNPATSDSAAAAPPTDPSVGEEAPVVTDVAGLRGEGPPDPAEGGVTWNVRTVTLADEAGPLVDVLSEAGYRVGVFRSADGVLSVLMGQFETEAAAEAARSGLPAWAQLRGEVVALDGYTLDSDDTE